MQKRTFLLMMLVLFGATACSTLPALSNNNSDNNEGVTSLISLNQNSRRDPAEVVRDFLTAWQEENFEQMYAFISPRSQEVYPYETFEQQYSNAHAEMGFSGVGYTLHDTRIQGDSAAISYDVTLISNSFGEIADTDRTMRLVNTDSGWQIAWAPMDIINGMTSDVTLSYVPSYPPRANIYDRNGLSLVENNGQFYRINIVEGDISNENACIDTLAAAMLKSRSYFIDLFTNYLPDAYFYVGEMEEDAYNQYRGDLNSFCGLNIPNTVFGDKVALSAGRNYFGKGAAAHVTGYIGRVPGGAQLTEWVQRGYRPTDIVGLTGVEYVLQDTLAGSPDRSLRLLSSGVTLRDLGGSEGGPATPVQLTIDRDLQLEFARAFNDAWNYAIANWVTVSPGGGGVIIDVNTGEVLAMVSYPTFDPRIFDPNSTYVNAADQIAWATQGNPFLPTGAATRNLAAGEQYAPGSTFKVLSTAAAADSGVWTRDEIFNCDLIWRGQEQFGDVLSLREDWRVVFEQPAAGPITMSQALTASCNPFFWQVGGLMYQQGQDVMADYARLFGLGSRTGIYGLLGEASGNIPTPPTPTDALNNVIGQGNSSATPLQMARAVAAIANGGTLYEPYIVKQVGGFDNQEIQEVYQPEVVRDLGLDPEVYDIVREGMCAVPDTELGTGYYIFGAGSVENDSFAADYSTCGKTGTAQAVIAPHSWYVAYAPEDNPQIAIAVVVPNSREGSEVAAPIVRRILDHYFNAPIAPFPNWWEDDYVPVEPPQGTFAG